MIEPQEEKIVSYVLGEATRNIEVSALKEHPSIKETFEGLPEEDYEALKTDIAKHGVEVPLHVLLDGRIIDGHQRWKAASENGIKTVPCQIVNLKSDTEIQKWAIKINLLRRHLTTEQKYLLLAKLSELYEVGQIRNGKGQFESRNLKVSSREGDVLERTAKELGARPATIGRARAYKRAIKKFPNWKGHSVFRVLNEYRRQKEFKQRKKAIKNAQDMKNLFLGDCLEKIDEVPDNSIDLLLTDPPYGEEGVDIWGREQTRKLRGKEWSYEGEDESIFPLLDNLLKKLVKKLKDNAHIYIFTTWKKLHKLYPIAEKYFKINTCLVWNKQVGALCEHEGYNYVPFYDLILFAEKGRRRLNYETQPSNILNFTRVQHNRKHPCEKPVDLLKTLISYSTLEGEMVLDCFAGSGSTLVAAEELGRNWIGIEKDPKWHEVAKARILELKKQGGASD